VFRAPTTPVVAGVDASWVTARAPAIAKLAAQIAARLEWASCLDVLFERGCRLFLELGPGGALSRMARERLGVEVEARSVSEFRSLDAVAAWLQRRNRAFAAKF
jgi:[acyl-carrier-protein] S-malonyltransferase